MGTDSLYWFPIITIVLEAGSSLLLDDTQAQNVMGFLGLFVDNSVDKKLICWLHWRGQSVMTGSRLGEV